MVGAVLALAAALPAVASAREGKPAAFSLGEVPVIVRQPVNQTVTAGEPATFEAEATGYTAVQWQVSFNGGETFVADTTDPGNNTPTLTVEKVPATATGWKYRAVFKNEAGTATSQAARLVVNVAPGIVSQPIGQTVAPGQAATFKAAATGRPTPTVEWQVSVDGGATFSNDRTDAGNTTGTLIVVPASFAQNGYEYRAVFSNTAGTATSAAATLTVIVPPVASFAWLPPSPHAGEPVSLISNSTDVASPIIVFGWDLIGSGPFVTGPAVLTTSFATPGEHLVRLRVTDANGLSSIAAQTIPVTSPLPALMRPFPVVRIEGANAGDDTRLFLLSVLAPVGSRVTVTCHGHGCPTRRATRVARSGRGKHPSRAVVVTFPVFEHGSLSPGAVLEVRVSGSGQIGKYTRFVIRRGRLPARADACLDPGSTKPIGC
jgi:hypothetical protein